MCVTSVKDLWIRLAVWRGKPANCSFAFDDFFSLLSFSSSLLWFQSQNKNGLVHRFRSFLAFCNRAHGLNTPNKRVNNKWTVQIKF